MASPNGDWYFTRPLVEHKGDDPNRNTIGDCDSDCDSDCDPDTDYTNYRDDADPTTFDPFLAAFAKAVQNMPVLGYFMLTSELGNSKGKFHIPYHAPGRDAEWGDEGAKDLKSRRVYYACQIGKAWTPEPETMEGLRHAGKAKYSGEVIERFLGSMYIEDWRTKSSRKRPRSPRYAPTSPTYRPPVDDSSEESPTYIPSGPVEGLGRGGRTGRGV
jgi:hypothetical protein